MKVLEQPCAIFAKKDMMMQGEDNCMQCLNLNLMRRSNLKQIFFKGLGKNLGLWESNW